MPISENNVLRTCKTHGETYFALRTEGRYRCKKCAVQAVHKRRRKIKTMAVDYHGRECNRCGIISDCNALYEFHHKDPSIKEFGISKNGHTMSWEKCKKELDKCIMVCANCHRLIHYTRDSGEI